jgi:DivIVA domain-containing protein
MDDNKKTILDIDTIINKEFNIDFKGYSPLEVDKFLDSVVHDYDTFQQQIAELHEKEQFLQDTNGQLKNKVMELEGKLKAAEDNANAAAAPSVPAAAGNLSQVDILRRIARLEQEVFNRK